MCTNVLVCHGDKALTFKKAYTAFKVKAAKEDCKPATYYITSDGKYAIDSEFVSADQIDTIDLEKVPKIKLK